MKNHLRDEKEGSQAKAGAGCAVGLGRMLRAARPPADRAGGYVPAEAGSNSGPAGPFRRDPGGSCVTSAPRDALSWSPELERSLWKP